MSKHTQRSRDPVRLPGLRVVLASVSLVVFLAAACSGGQGNGQSPSGVSTQPDAGAVTEAQSLTAVLSLGDAPVTGDGESPGGDFVGEALDEGPNGGGEGPDAAPDSDGERVIKKADRAGEALDEGPNGGGEGPDAAPDSDGERVSKNADRAGEALDEDSNGVGEGPDEGPDSDSEKVSENAAVVIFPQQDGTLGTEEEMERFVGKLVLDRECLRVKGPTRDRDSAYFPVPPLLIWPADSFTLSLEEEVVGIVDASGRVVARVGDDVQFSAAAVTYGQAMEHGGLEEISLACSAPPYWVVGDDFTYSLDSQPTTLMLTDPKVYFFRQRAIEGPVTERMTAAAAGTLVLVDNCLRLAGGEAMVWPAGFTPDVYRGVVQVRNENGYVIAKVGDRLFMGGGEVPGTYGECPGSAWHAHSIRVAPDSTTPFDPRPDPDDVMGVPDDITVGAGQ